MNRKVGLSPHFSFFLYVYDCNEQRETCVEFVSPKGVTIMGEIVIIPVPNGTEIICE